MNRQIKNGTIDSIELLFDDANNLFLKFRVQVSDSRSITVYKFKKPKWELRIEELMMFFDVKNWDDIINLWKIRIMIDDGNLRAIGRFDEEKNGSKYFHGILLRTNNEIPNITCSP